MEEKQAGPLHCGVWKGAGFALKTTRVGKVGTFLAGALPDANTLSLILLASLQAGQVGALFRHQAVWRSKEN